MSKHTPGYYECDHCGEQTANTDLCGACAANGDFIEKASEDSRDDREAVPVQAEANARLIAAAPELLEALREVVRALGEGKMPTLATAEYALEVIAKAEGRDND